MKMKMTATGDSILMRKIEEGGYEGMREVTEWLSLGEARLGNLETTVTEYDAYAAVHCGGFWQTATPDILDEFHRYRLNMLGFANNHTYDFGPDGCLETLRHARAKGLLVAGAGKDLGEAAAPAYLDTAGGRVALIAFSSSFPDEARAGYPNKYFKGRPGLNPLRDVTEYWVSEEHFRELKEIEAATEINGQRNASRKNGFSENYADDYIYFSGSRISNAVRFRLSPDGTEGKHSKCNPNDLKRMRESVAEARTYAEYVVIEVHSHQLKHADMSEPDWFFEEFARAAVDAGADMVVGGGVHHLRPVEIYKGKPIFYSLGNFIFQVDLVVREPFEVEEKLGPGKHMSCKLTEQEFNYRTVVPYVEFEDGKLTKLLLKPMDLGFGKDRSHLGLPCIAGRESAEKTFAELSERSKPYGTEMKLLTDGTIEVVLE